MAADGQVVFEIKGNNDDIKKTLRQTTDDINKETKNWDKSVDDSSGNISSSLVGAFSKIVASAAFVKVSQMLIKLGSESVELASDLEEVQNVVDVTFGASGAAKIETWAKNAGRQFGLTELQAKQYASTLGAMMKSSGLTGDEIEDMSMGLAGLAADMASFYNLDFDEAFQKIQSGMAGMSMPLRSLGIDMTDTAISASEAVKSMGKEWSDMDTTEKTIARYKYLMSVTKDAQGDFARTSEGYANTQRRLTTGITALKAQLGAELLPVVTDITNAIAGMIEKIAGITTGDAFKDIAKNEQETMDQIDSDESVVNALIKHLESISTGAGAAEGKLSEWQETAKRLVQYVPTLANSLDIVNGKFTAQASDIKAATQEFYANARAQAIQTANQERFNMIAQQRNDITKKEVDIIAAKGKNNYDDKIAQIAEWYQAVLGSGNITEGAKAQLRGYGLSEDISSWRTGDYITALQGLSALRMGGNLKGERNIAEGVYGMEGSKEVANLTEVMKLEAELSGLNATLKQYEEEYKMYTSAGEEYLKTIQEGLDAIPDTKTITITVADQTGLIPGVPSIASFGPNSQANGLDYVPYDGYLALLHQGERIQTAAEADLSRRYSYQQPAFDYSAMGGAIGANIGRGNVYLDGRTVGEVLSSRQANSYRALERSGWQG